MRTQHILAALLAAFLTVAASTTPAGAAHWIIMPQTSSIRFSGTQMGQPLIGRFERFGGQIEFEPGAAPKGAVRIEIEIASIRTGAEDRDTMAMGEDWFLVKRMPKAVFTAQTFKSTGVDTYEADGQLTIKGTTKRQVLPFSLFVDASGRAEITGKITLDRRTFDLGAGQFADAAMVGHSVDVDIRVHAQRAP